MARRALICLAAAAAVTTAAPHIVHADREAIVVLGAAVGKDGQPGPRLTARLDSTLKLARQKPNALIVVSGGTVTSKFAEGPVMARWLRERGISAKRIRIESKAKHTGDNADLVMPILRKEGIRTATVVTDRFHVPRARFHFRSAGREQGYRVKLRSFAVPDGLSGRDRMLRAMSERKKIHRDSKWRAQKSGKTRGAYLKKRLKGARVKGRGR